MSKIQTIHTPGKLENIAINGALDFWQDKVSSTTTVNTATGGTVWIADMVRASHAGTSVKNFSVVRSTNVPDVSQCGFDVQYSSQFTQITGIPSLAATDIINPFLYSVEGYDYQRMHGKKVTFGIWAFSSIAGTYSFGLRNSAATRSYVTTFNINQANTWEFKQITVQMDTSTSGYDFTTGVGILVSIGSVAGSSNVQSPSTSWQNNGLSVANTATNWAGTSGAVLRFTLFSIVEGSMGFGAKGFQRSAPTVAAELVACQHYYEKSYSLETAPGTAGIDEGIYNFQMNQGSTVQSILPIKFLTTKRTIPSVTFYARNGASGSWWNYNAGSAVAVAGQVGGQHSWAINTAAFPAGVNIGGHYVADARL